jgi:hypothetical protein
VNSSGEPGGLDSRRTIEALDLEPRILAKDPRARLVDGTAEDGLAASVLVVRLTDLWRVVACVERLDLPVRKGIAELTKLPRIRRSQDRLYGFQRAPRTAST